MKTTIEIADSVLNEARKLAIRDKTTVRNLVEQGLRRVVAERKHTGKFQLRHASFAGKGLQSELRQASWEELRERSYEYRGGEPT